MHYDMIADAVSRGWSEFNGTEVDSDVVAEAIIDRLGDAFHSDNPKFDRERFEAACEPRV